jgi:hypothetical protein
MMERYLTVQIIDRRSGSISDFRDVVEGFDACTIVQWWGSPLFLFMAGSFIRAMNKEHTILS